MIGQFPFYDEYSEDDPIEPGRFENDSFLKPTFDYSKTMSKHDSFVVMKDQVDWEFV